MQKLSIGISPCPNDTFIFDALLHGKIDTHGLQFELVLDDVEQLNQRALKGELDITKLSYAALPHVTNQYALLNTGSALGKGVGPLLVCKKEHALANTENLKIALSASSIAIPGKFTTAHQLLSLFATEATDKRSMIFHEIESAVLNGSVDAGVLIHEGRFTYADKGLHLLQDLGAWWEDGTHTAIPLGGIVIKRNLGKEVYHQINDSIKRSVQYSWQQYPSLSKFITNHAQEMNDEVMRQHILLYVNNYTENLGEDGKKAIEQFCKMPFSELT